MNVRMDPYPIQFSFLKKSTERFLLQGNNLQNSIETEIRKVYRIG